MRIHLLTIAFAAVLSACGEPESTPTAPETTAESTTAPAVTEIKMTELPIVTIGPYTVQPMYEDDLAGGHFNLTISGGDVAAVREWVGPEDASGVMVVKTEIERDYWHGHVEMPDPIPADARLWIEIETPTGELHKGSTALK